MGIGGISMWQLLILLLIVVLVFGTKRLRNMGTDLGAAVTMDSIEPWDQAYCAEK